jgi:uncharacterized membrane protein YuzA (DUF378 family)/ribosomal protein S15P/S13E
MAKTNSAPGICRRPELTARVLLCLAVLLLAVRAPFALAADGDGFYQTLDTLSRQGDRSTGTPGCASAAAYLRERLEASGPGKVFSHAFTVPVMERGPASLEIPGHPPLPLLFLAQDALSPQCAGPEGITGPLVYAGHGDPREMEGLPLEGAVVALDLDSGKNWQNPAALGARAAIFLTKGDEGRPVFEDKFELTPVRFPRLVLSRTGAEKIFGPLKKGVLAEEVRLLGQSWWKEADAENLAVMVEGADPALAKELLVVEAFYDGSAGVSGNAPAADEAVGAATLLEIAQHFKNNPPKRSVLLLATAGHAQSLAGVREALWALRAKSKDLLRREKDARGRADLHENLLDILKKPGVPENLDKEEETLFLQALSEPLKTECDCISRDLMRLRTESRDAASSVRVREMAGQRLVLRRLTWRQTCDNVSADEKAAILAILAKAVEHHEALRRDAKKRRGLLASAQQLQALVHEKEPVAWVSLHLSSHGSGLGAFSQGFLVELNEDVNRTPATTAMDEALNRAARAAREKEPGLFPFMDTLRPSRERPWDSWFQDRPPLGGEAAALAGLIGVTLATVDDARARWGTPGDTLFNVDVGRAKSQARLALGLVDGLARAQKLHDGVFPRQGLGELLGRAKILRSGEIFADQPAPGTVVLAFQGPARYLAMADGNGEFLIKGAVEKKLTLHKVVLEGYRHNLETGLAEWAIDKGKTSKDAYRVKMQRRNMETDLVLFPCAQTTLFNLLDPRSFRPMTRIQVLDARTDAPPLHYWYSRVDTRESTLAALFLEPGSRFKLTLSDSVAKKKLVLTNSRTDNPLGAGYPVDNLPALIRTELLTARDMWTLLKPRMENLEQHGVRDTRIQGLALDGQQALDKAEKALARRNYGTFAESARTSWALASRVYGHVDTAQKDVLLGVLFYIALFIPFAFCLERLLVSSTNIHTRILTFLGILAALILTIRQVHPAFQLARSPMVVILAFFIIGLSALVSLIIFFRFEEETKKPGQRAGRREAEKWRAFSSAFLLGISNLRRRKARTALTIITLVLLTFTLMSFTSVSGARLQQRTLVSPSASRPGFFLKNANWNALAPEALGFLENSFGEKFHTAPRVWLETPDRTRPVRVPVRRGNQMVEAQGLVGLSPEEPRVTGMDAALVGGRWLAKDAQNEVLLSETTARSLGIPPENPAGAEVFLWGRPFTTAGVFSGKKYEARTGLDGEPVTPVVFPSDAVARLTETELEAMEADGDAILGQGRWRHIAADQVVIAPARAVLAMGGKAVGLAARPKNTEEDPKEAERLADRYGLPLFQGGPRGTHSLYAGDSLSYSGLPNVAVPIAIAVLIVLNTMIGSVFERRREIGVYTSVGLAPSHVGFLFIAEALAFAVLSVVAGYVLAQTLASLFAGTALWAGVTVNYSSLSGVFAMALVILVVLLSVVYPSRVASALAIPDVNRSFRMPEPEGDALTLTLPFLLKYTEIQSVAGLLHAHYKDCQEGAHEAFTVDRLALAHACPLLRGGGEAGLSAGPGRGNALCMRLSFEVWLAPFDFGISQAVELDFCPAAEDLEYAEARVRMERLSGETGQWKRAAKRFLNDLRKELLVWRSLDAAEKERFAGRLAEAGPDLG